MTANHDSPWDKLDEPTRQFYLRALAVLDESGVGYCVAGAYALDSSAPIEVLPLTEEVS